MYQFENTTCYIGISFTQSYRVSLDIDKHPLHTCGLEFKFHILKEIIVIM